MESKLSLKIVKQMFDSLSFDDRKQFKTLLFDKNRSKTVNIITNYNIIFDIISRIEVNYKISFYFLNHVNLIRYSLISGINLRSNS